MKIASIIPARGGSKGIPKKNLVDFNGKPLISYSIQQSLESKLINDVFVTSDSNEILDISSLYGANKILRPKDLSTDISSSEDALLHAINEIEKKNNYDFYVFLQATSPIRTSDDIDNSINTLINNKLDSLFSACELEDFLIWEKKGEILESLNYDFKNRKRRQDHEPQYVENGSIYVFEKKQFLINKNRLFGKIGIYIMENWKMFEIDNLSDLDFCSLVYKNKISKK